MSHRIAALTIAAAALFGLTACTGSPFVSSSTPGAPITDEPGDAGQSTADACALVRQSIEDATAEFENVSTADPTAVVDAMRAAVTELADTAGHVTNDEVAALLPTLQDMYTEAAAVMEAIAKGDVTKVGDLADLGAQFQKTSEEFQQLCTV